MLLAPFVYPRLLKAIRINLKSALAPSSRIPLWIPWCNSFETLSPYRCVDCFWLAEFLSLWTCFGSCAFLLSSTLSISHALLSKIKICPKLGFIHLADDSLWDFRWFSAINHSIQYCPINGVTLYYCVHYLEYSLTNSSISITRNPLFLPNQNLVVLSLRSMVFLWLLLISLQYIVPKFR